MIADRASIRIAVEETPRRPAMPAPLARGIAGLRRIAARIAERRPDACYLCATPLAEGEMAGGRRALCEECGLSAMAAP